MRCTLTSRQWANRLRIGLEAAAAEQGQPIQANHIGSLVQLLWGEIADPHTMPGVYRSDRDKVTSVMEGMIGRGVYTHRKGLFFLNAAHGRRHRSDHRGVLLRPSRRFSNVRRRTEVTVLLDAHDAIYDRAVRCRVGVGSSAASGSRS